MKEKYGHILTQFAAAMKGMGLYPPGHPAVTSPVEKLTDILAGILAKKGQVLLGIVDKVMVLDGIPFQRTNPSVEELMERLEKRNVEGIIFKKGLHHKDIRVLLDLLFTEPAVLNNKGGAVQFLAHARVTHIELRKLEEKDVYERAREVYAEARQEVASIMQEARLGHIPDAHRAISIFERLSGILSEEKSALLGLTMIKDFDHYTFTHCVNVGVLSLALAAALKLKPALQMDIALAGFLHDIGKTVTPVEIINKPGILTTEEWEVMKKHPVEGSKIIRSMKNLSDLTVTSVYQHHSKYNKTGYPPIPDNEKMNAGACIVAIADAYDSMTTQRPYQKRFDPKEALEIMARRTGVDFDPQIMDVFVRMLGLYPIGSLVRLDTNEIALVMKLHPDDPLRPVVKILFDADGNAVKKPTEVSLADTDPATGRPARTIITGADALTQGLTNISEYFQ